MKNVLIFVTCSLIFLSCETGDVGNNGVLAIKLSGLSSQVSGGLQMSDVKGFKIKIYNNIPKKLDSSPYFESDCIAYCGDSVIIDKLSTGKNRVVIVEGYREVTNWSDLICDPSKSTGSVNLVCQKDQISYRGIRGGIEIVENPNNQAFYFIPMFKVQGIVAFPLPDPSLDEKAATTACKGDEDCKKMIPCAKEEGCVSKYIIHPAATCDKNIGKCRYLDNLFPLNSHTERAFHTATELSIGEILIAGGYNSLKGGLLTVNDPYIEQFNPSTSLFSIQKYGKADFDELQMRHAYHAAVKLSNDQIIFFGGAQEMQIKTDASSTSAIKLEPKFCPNPPVCGTNLLNNMTVIDPMLRTFNTNLLMNDGIAGALNSVILPQSSAQQTSILIAGGFIQVSGDKVDSTDKAFICSFDPDAVKQQMTSCIPTSSFMTAKRTFHTGTCAEIENGLCKKFLIVGGNVGEGTNLMETFSGISSAKFDAVQTTLTEEITAMYHSKIVRQGDRYFSFGGYAVKSSSDEFLAPLEIQFDPAKNEASILKISVNEQDSELFRVFHEVTKLSETSFLVTGGVTRDGIMAKEALLFKLVSGELKLEKRIPLALPRAAHTATLITNGLLSGSVLLIGGFEIQEPLKKLEFVKGAELYLNQ